MARGGHVDFGDQIGVTGCSFGAYHAMALALRHPGLVERLCVVDVSPVAYASTTSFAGYIEAMLAIDLSTLQSRQAAEAALVQAVPDPTFTLIQRKAKNMRINVDGQLPPGMMIASASGRSVRRGAQAGQQRLSAVGGPDRFRREQAEAMRIERLALRPRDR